MIRAGLLVAAMSAATPLLAADALQVQVPAQYAEHITVLGNIRSECGLEGLVGNAVFEAVRKHYPEATAVADPSRELRGRSLKLTILTAEGVGGGGWSGSKAMTVRAELVQDGAVIQTGVRRDKSRGGMWGPGRGTCSIFGAVAEALGEQLADWLVYVDRKSPAAKAPAAPAPRAAEPAVDAAPAPTPPAPAGDNPQSAS